MKTTCPRSPESRRAWGLTCSTAFPFTPWQERHLESSSSRREAWWPERGTRRWSTFRQMSHCTRCRADAVGKLGEAMTQELLDCLQAARSPQAESRPVRGRRQRRGNAGEPASWRGRRTLDLRCKRPSSCNPARAARGKWLAAMARNGSAAERLSGRARQRRGETPSRLLTDLGVTVRLTEGLVADAVAEVYQGRPATPPRRAFRCGDACAGQGTGCG